MSARIPPEAFETYVRLGPGRSYRQVAERYGVSKRAVTSFAAREQWPERLAKVDSEARVETDKRAVDGLTEMNQRHTKIAKALQGKALEALKNMPLESARDVIRALDLGVRQERLILGEPTERQANVEEVTKREIHDMLVVDEDDDDDCKEEAAAG